MSGYNPVDVMRDQVRVLMQRNALAGHDLTELSALLVQLTRVQDELHRLRMLAEFNQEKFDAIKEGYDELLTAVFTADEEHAIIGELIERTRDEELAELEASGMVRTDDVMLKILDVMGIPISEAQAAEFAAWLLGLRGTVDSNRGNAMADAIREFLEKVSSHE